MDALEGLSDLELLKLVSERIKEAAFEIPSPNPTTPRLVMLANAIDNEVNRRRAPTGTNHRD
ncbi:MAG: hypothetical protein RLW68_00745 [Devosia marina]|uniref:hypothetical protein n=1 Tax=Devosia marina TaxID=2683198 RepID=UPI0032ECED88